jgi:CMP-N-acetylneuraminic acid synthetase
MTVVAFVPARAGSTRIPRKNLAEVGGVPLVRRAVAAALAAGVDRVVVSTDDTKIAIAAGCSHALLGGDRHIGTDRVERHVRRADHADAHAQIEDAVRHWMLHSAAALDDSDTVVLTHPTAPFRTADTIQRVIEAARASESGCALTVTRDPKHYFAGVLDGDGVNWRRPLNVRPRTQDLAHWVHEDGIAYAFTVAHFNATRSRMHPQAAAVPIEWPETIDIDTPDQLEYARWIAERTGR